MLTKSVSDKIKNSFFIIHSDNLEDIKTKFYGYCIQNNNIIDSIDNLNEEELDGNGAYIFIKRFDKKVVIKQDFIGSYGLYLYKNDEFFAISNCFQYLVDFLKTSHKITLNEDYSNTLLNGYLCSFAYSETLIKEINMLSRHTSIEIDIDTKSITFSNIDYSENSIEPDSEEGIKILDNWYNKWRKILNGINSSDKKLITDLSGGYDSRLTLPLLLDADMQPDSAHIYSQKEPKSKFAEDFEIASEIADYYNLRLNTTPKIKESHPLTPEDRINLSFYIKLGFSNEMYFKTNYTSSIYNLCGYGGELLRKIWEMPLEEHLESLCKEATSKWRKSSTKIKNHIADSIFKIGKNSINKIKEKYNYLNSTDLNELDMLYKETRCRNHFGKASVEAFLYGIIFLSPLMDPEMNKLKKTCKNCSDKNFLIALILTRYHNLLKFKIQGNRSIGQDTIRYAETINSQYPFKKEPIPETVSKIDASSDEDMISYSNTHPNVQNDVNEFILKIFHSKNIKKTIKNIYGFNIYRKMNLLVKRVEYYPLRRIYPALAIAKAKHDTLLNEYLLKHPNEEYDNTIDIVTKLLIDDKLYRKITKKPNFIEKFFLRK